MRVFICADMEGVSGVVTRRQTDDYDSAEYAAACARMQADVQAAVEACRQMGATDIVVADSHGPATNLDPDQFAGDVTLVQGWPRPLNMMQGIEQGHYDAALLIGHHAAITSIGGGYPHSFSSSQYSAVRVNGEDMSEGVFNCALAGHYGVPVVAASGDDHCLKDLQLRLPDLSIATTKYSHGMYSATQLPRDQALELIRQAVSAGLAEAEQRTPLRIEGPIDLELRLKNRYFAELLSYLPGWERRDAFAVAVTVEDVPAAAGVIGALVHMSVDCY